MQQDSVNQQAISLILSRKKLSRRLAKYVHKQLRKLDRAYDESLSDNSRDAVHDIRVATRRLGSALRVAGLVKSERAFKREEKVLKRLRHVLSTHRDNDVMLEAMQDEAEHVKTQHSILLWDMALRRSRAEGAKTQAQSRQQLGAVSIRKLQRRIKHDVEYGVKGRFSGHELALGLEQAKANLERTVKCALNETDLSSYHDVRIKAKTLRYLLELTAHLTRSDALSQLVNELKDVQDRLGQWHDQFELSRRLAILFSDNPSLQADPVATSIIDSARKQTDTANHEARRLIQSLPITQWRRELEVVTSERRLGASAGNRIDASVDHRRCDQQHSSAT